MALGTPHCAQIETTVTVQLMPNMHACFSVNMHASVLQTGIAAAWATMYTCIGGTCVTGQVDALSVGLDNVHVHDKPEDP